MGIKHAALTQQLLENSYRGNVDACLDCIERGARVNEQDSRGCTPLHNAVMHVNKALAEMLLDHGADTNVKDTIGKTPLHYSTGTHFAEVGELGELGELGVSREEVRGGE